MALASEALDSARTYLNDQGKQIWSDALLIPFLKEAYKDLLLALKLNEIPVIMEKSAAITVNIGATTLTLPADIVEPVKLKERLFGSSESFINMSEKAWEPDITQSSTLRYWAWREEVLELVGATTKREVLLFYIKTLTAPTLASSSLGFINAETYLGPKTAVYAASSLGNSTLAGEANRIAEDKLEIIIRYNVKNKQGLPVRRLPYNRIGKMRPF